MAAPTNAARVKKVLANLEPSFCDNAALRSLSERSGHQLVGKTCGIGRE
jgi:hypothetical protein